MLAAIVPVFMAGSVTAMAFNATSVEDQLPWERPPTILFPDSDEVRPPNTLHVAFRVFVHDESTNSDGGIIRGMANQFIPYINEYERDFLTNVEGEYVYDQDGERILGNFRLDANGNRIPKYREFYKYVFVRDDNGMFVVDADGVRVREYVLEDGRLVREEDLAPGDNRVVMRQRVRTANFSEVVHAIPDPGHAFWHWSDEDPPFHWTTDEDGEPVRTGTRQLTASSSRVIENPQEDVVIYAIFIRTNEPPLGGGGGGPGGDSDDEGDNMLQPPPDDDEPNDDDPDNQGRPPGSWELRPPTGNIKDNQTHILETIASLQRQINELLSQGREVPVWLTTTLALYIAALSS